MGLLKYIWALSIFLLKVENNEAAAFPQEEDENLDVGVEEIFGNIGSLLNSLWVLEFGAWGYWIMDTEGVDESC